MDDRVHALVEVLRDVAAADGDAVDARTVAARHGLLDDELTRAAFVRLRFERTEVAEQARRLAAALLVDDDA